MSTRIYVVINKSTGERRLVEATSQAAAIRHCTLPNFEVTTAGPKMVADCMTHGLKIETATTTTQGDK